ncbi:predicted protein [Plenodomus lingam JN3]|uniref:Predicted protein n=1 Tax=Leptosphaeria maculans (strain JN3 / isolate v23.1.3 / race Av1-4-5-6-7-8) TaxID=985895 RepID=E4ZVA9_LEPMJ|nr:predicted protein [Plenodomus lingam JN3]CBX95535.1 predicted protein [Plenodomus lingam JN3]
MAAIKTDPSIGDSDHHERSGKPPIIRPFTFMLLVPIILCICKHTAETR